MDAPLLQFIRHLRHHGVAVSPSETLDAMQVAAALGYADRSLLYHGLRTSLAKSEEDQEAFARCFGQFFQFDPPPTAGNDAESADGDAREDAEGDTPDEPGNGDGGGQSQGGGGGMGLSERDNQEAFAEVMQAAADVGLENMTLSTQRGIYRMRMLDALNDKQRRAQIAELEAGDAEQQAQAQWLQGQRDAQLEMIQALMDRQLLLNNNAASRAYQEQLIQQSNIAALDRYYRDRLPPLIRKLAKKLAAKHRQRHRRAKRGKLDVGKTLRRSIAYDGIPFERHWRNTRREKSDIYVLCDLSGSVSSWSEVLLLFVQSLAGVLPHTRTFVFCGPSVEVSELFKQHDPDTALALIQQRHGMGASDYGAALHTFRDQVIDTVNRRSTVIILGDGRNNGGDPGLEALRELYLRSRLVLWFNPEARSRWQSGDSEIRRYQTACHYVAECGSVQKLERLLDGLLTLLL